MGARRWEQARRPRISRTRRRVERAVLSPAIWLVVAALDRRVRRALVR